MVLLLMSIMMSSCCGSILSLCCSRCSRVGVDDEVAQDFVAKHSPMSQQGVDELGADLLNVEGVGAEVDGSESIVAVVELDVVVFVEIPFVDVELLDALVSCRCSALCELMCSTASKQITLMSLFSMFHEHVVMSLFRLSMPV